MRVGILGLGSWGTAIAALLAGRQHSVAGWTHDPSQRRLLRDERENRKYLPGIPLPPFRVEESIGDLVSGAEAVILAVPSHALREVAGQAAGAIPRSAVIVNVAKGLEEGTLFRMSEILASIPGLESRSTVSLLGPSHAEEVSRQHPTALVAASTDAAAARAVQELFNGETLRVYTSPDLVGVELAASLKNIIAIAAGISAGVGFGDNSFGALVARGLAEMARLGLAQGGRPETFSGLSGLGDLVTTCVSRHSRNRWVGFEIGRGRNPAEVLAGMTMVAEGVRTTRAGVALAHRIGVEMPIAEQVQAVLFAGKNPRQAITDLMLREPKAELA